MAGDGGEIRKEGGVWGGISFYILIRCGFGGFGKSICLAIYATCLQLVDACQSSQRKALLSHLTWRSKKRERRLYRKVVFLALFV